MCATSTATSRPQACSRSGSTRPSGGRGSCLKRPAAARDRTTDRAGGATGNLLHQRQPDPARDARLLSGVDQAGASDRLVQIAFAAARRGAHKIGGDSAEPVWMVRPFRQGWRAGPAALLRVRLHDHSVAYDADLALFTFDLDRVRALVGGPGQKDVAHAGGGIQVNARRVL